MFIGNIKKNTVVCLKKYYKKTVFVLIFALLCFVYNYNSQTLNAYLNRGIILEYSIPSNVSINKDEIEKKLSELNFEYYLISETDNDKYSEFDSDAKLIKKELEISLPVLAKDINKDIINNISDFIFENYPSSKLIDIETRNDVYSKKFNVLNKYLILFLFAYLIYTFIFMFFEKEETQEEKKDTTYYINILLKKGIVEFLKQIILNISNVFEETKVEFLQYVKNKKEAYGEFIDEVKTKGCKRIIKSIVKEILSTVVFVVVALILIKYFIGEPRWIPTGSMIPTIIEHDRVFVEQLRYPKKEIQRGDILVFYPPKEKLSNNPLSVLARLTGIFCQDIAYIKRVVGMPNDKLEVKYIPEIDEFRVYINDVALNEPYIRSLNDWPQCVDGMHCGPFIVPENSYFMMGDNRGNSEDSRYWGFLDKSRVIGRANYMFFPLSRLNLLKDKYYLLHKENKDGKIIEYNYLINRY